MSGVVVALSHRKPKSNSAPKFGSTRISQTEQQSTTKELATSSSASSKPVIVVNNGERALQAQSLAEAWGLTKFDSDDDEASLHENNADDEEQEVSGKGGLGMPRPKLDEKSLEHRIHRAKDKQNKNLAIKSIELSVWNDDNEQEDDDTLSRTKAASHRKKPKITRAFDGLSTNTTHPAEQAVKSNPKLSATKSDKFKRKV